MSKLVKGGSLPQPPQHQQQQPDQRKVREREREKRREERSGDMQSRVFISLTRSVAWRERSHVAVFTRCDISTVFLVQPLTNTNDPPE